MQTTARFLWQRLESYHGLVYFVPEADQHYTALGLEPGMMGYFGSRSAAMGAVSPEVVIATFYNFEPTRIREVVPEVWTRVTPDRLWDARLAAVDDALGRIFAGSLAQHDLPRAVDMLRRTVDSCSPDGRPLFAGHAGKPWPTEPHLALWFGITLLREYRGDGHVASLTAEGVSGIEALVIHGATGAVPSGVLKATRGWSDEAWAAARLGLEVRGWLTPDGHLTPEGRVHRDAVERRTDRLAAAPWTRLSDDEAMWLARLGKELTTTIVEAGTFPRR